MTPPRILVVDDEQHIVQVLSLTLRRAGYDVITATDGDAAWRAIENDEPDLLITDESMPGITGTQLIERLQHHRDHAELPILIITARRMAIEPHDHHAVTAILPKPFSPREVLSKVHDLVGEASVQQEIEL
ncbi:MAG: response regulator [Phycisphaerales bacterium JB063]